MKLCFACVNMVGKSCFIFFRDKALDFFLNFLKCSIFSQVSRSWMTFLKHLHYKDVDLFLRRKMVQKKYPPLRKWMSIFKVWIIVIWQLHELSNLSINQFPVENVLEILNFKFISWIASFWAENLCNIYTCVNMTRNSCYFGLKKKHRSFFCILKHYSPFS